MWRLLLALSILQLAQSACPDGFDLVRDGQCRGFYKTDRMDARLMGDAVASKCNEIGAQPVIIHDKEEQSYWQGVAVKVQTPFVVLGLVCNSKTKRWEWVDGSPVDYRPPAGTINIDLDKECSMPSINYGTTWTMEYDGKWFANGGPNTYTFYLYCTKQVAPLPLPNGDCDGFEDDSEVGVCYQVEPAVATWKDAQATCQKFGADLASIHNEKENSFLRRVAVSRGVTNGLFLGAYKPENEFKWIDGSKWDYSKFYTGFPMDGLGVCVAMDTLSTSGEWINTECDSKFAVGCVRQPSTHTCSPGPWKEGEIILSPRFPFDASIPCDYMLTVAAGKRVQVEVQLLEANSCCDHLILAENPIGNTIIANLTGDITSKTYTTKSSNIMRVSWQPNGGVNVRGVKFTYRGV